MHAGELERERERIIVAKFNWMTKWPSLLDGNTIKGPLLSSSLTLSLPSSGSITHLRMQQKIFSNQFKCNCEQRL